MRILFFTIILLFLQCSHSPILNYRPVKYFIGNTYVGDPVKLPLPDIDTNGFHLKKYLKSIKKNKGIANYVSYFVFTTMPNKLIKISSANKIYENKEKQIYFFQKKNNYYLEYFM